MKKTRNISLLIICTSLLLWFIDTYTGKILTTVKIDNIGKINAVMNHDLDYELTVWGSSTALRNFNTDRIDSVLNISSFNMGIDGTNIDQYDGLLYEYISYTEKSKFLIIAIDIHGGLVKRNQLYNIHNWVHHIDNDNIYNSLVGIDSASIFKAKHIPFYSLILYDVHSFSYFKYALLNPLEKYSFPNSGTNYNHTTIGNKVDTTKAFNAKIDPLVFDKVKKACNLALKKNIQPLIVLTPCYYKGLEKILNVDEFVETVSAIESDFIKVYNFIKIPLTKDCTNFQDNTHLNYSGASKLADTLVKKLKLDYNLSIR